VEFIVQLFRALANYERIKILRLLVVFQELRVSGIAEATGLSVPSLSGHLKALGSAGLCWKRRSGRHVHYSIAGDAAHPVVNATVAALRRAFASMRPGSQRSVANATSGRSAAESDAALFACFTAFTHPRRLQITRRMASGPAALDELASELSMSQSACLRHMAKLSARGMVRPTGDKKRSCYRLAMPTDPVQRAITQAVRTHIAGSREES